MKYLLDTHIILWALTDDRRIEPFRDVIADPENEIYFSSASIWEIAIKHEKGHLDFDPEEVNSACIEQGYTLLSITAKHAIGTANLVYPENAPSHNDPFDKMLIAQAKTEGMFFLTVDEKILRYNEFCVKQM